MFRFISESSQCIVACPHNVWSVYICPTKALRHERRPKCRQDWQWHSKIGKKRRRCSQKRPLLPACTTSAPKKGHSIPRFWQPPPSLTSLKTDTTANWGFVLAWYSRIQSFKLSNQVKQSNGQRHLYLIWCHRSAICKGASLPIIMPCESEWQDEIGWLFS